MRGGRANQVCYSTYTMNSKECKSLSGAPNGLTEKGDTEEEEDERTKVTFTRYISRIVF